MPILELIPTLRRPIRNKIIHGLSSPQPLSDLFGSERADAVEAEN